MNSVSLGTPLFIRRFSKGTMALRAVPRLAPEVAEVAPGYDRPAS